MDRDKVIKGLKCCQYSSKSHCDGCPYAYESLCNTNDCTADLVSDALALLKEQEQKLVCTKCNGQPKGVICGICGQAVKLDG